MMTGTDLAPIFATYPSSFLTIRGAIFDQVLPIISS